MFGRMKILQHHISTNEALAKVVIPVKTGIQRFCNTLKRLDSHFRGNDKLLFFKTFARSSNVMVYVIKRSEGVHRIIYGKSYNLWINASDSFDTNNIGFKQLREWWGQ